MAMANKATPRGDARLRVLRSEKLWVINRVWSEDKTRVIGYVAFDSIQRSVYSIVGKNGEWVRYNNQYHPLHNPQELEIILKESNKLEYGFFNNGVRHSFPAVEYTTVAHFIFPDEQA
jgi:hypothetical protein